MDMGSSTMVHALVAALSKAVATADFSKQWEVYVAFLDLTENAFKGLIPEVVGSWSLMEHFKIPDAVTSWSELLVCGLHSNKLTGPIPDALTSFTELEFLYLSRNKLTGSIPHRHLSLAKLSFKVDTNQLSGSLGISAISSRMFSVSENQLTGRLPNNLCGMTHFVTAGNMLEGTVPKLVCPVQLIMLDISGRPGKIGALRGPLPRSLTRSCHLALLLACRQNLGGVIPSLAATLAMLSLHSNELKVMSDVRFKNANEGAPKAAGGLPATVFVHNNLLSCHLPECSNLSVKFSISALGNQLSHRSHGFPSWVSPMERDELLWIADTEGLVVLLKVVFATGFAVCVMSAKFGVHGLLSIMSRWQAQLSSHRQLAFRCSHLLSCLSRAAIFRVFFLMFLLSWDLYTCPPSLALASACLHEGTLTHILVFLMWECFGFHERALRSLATPRAHEAAAAHRTSLGRSSLPVLILVILMLSLPAILLQVGRSVPGAFAASYLVVAMLSACIGVLQGLLGSLVMPQLEQKITSRKHVYSTVANLLLNCFFPAAVIVSLDTACFGNWVRFWKPCRCNDKRFTQFAPNNNELYDGFFRHQHKLMVGLRPAEICDPIYARRQTSMSHCIELTLLRLQDIWLGKLITSGLLIPAGSICADLGHSNSNEVVDQLVVLMAYSIIASGHLPLVVLLLLLSTISRTLQAAVSWSTNCLKLKSRQSAASASIIMVQVLTAAAQLVSASGDLRLTAILLVCFLISRSCGLHT